MFNLSFSILPIFFVCLFISSLILKKIKFSVKNFDSLSRDSPLDSLRGFLALSVLVHHFVITYQWKTSGIWARPQSDLLNNFGAIPVSLFFIITGYLFFSKMFQSKNINWKKLYLSRLKRIVPLYLFVACIILITTFFSMESFNEIDKHVVYKWIRNWILFKGGPLLDFSSNLIIAGVNWTLLYEWAFYFSLPFFYLLIQKKINNKLLFFITLIFFSIIFLKTQMHLYLLFLLAIPAILYKDKLTKIIYNNQFILNIFTILLISFCFTFTTAYSFIQKILVAIIFLLINNGISIFGLLNNNQMKILGDISYSVYLIHGIVLYFAFSIFNIYDFSNGLITYYLYFPLIFLIVIVCSMLTYRFIEKPFLK